MSARSLPALFVGSVWIAMVYIACAYIHRYASPVPVLDDMEMTFLLVPREQTVLELLWFPASEHRIPLPRLVYLGLLYLTRDFRSACYFQVGAQAVVALAFIAFARRLRGRISYADAFFPLLWLNLGNCENFLLGMQISTSLATVLTCVVLMTLTARAGPPTARRSLLVGACLCLMPLCGGFGLCQLPPIALWLAFAGVARWRNARRTAAMMIAASVLSVAMIAVYFYHAPWLGQPVPAERTVGAAIPITAQFLTLNFGPIAADFPWLATIATLGLLLGAVAWLVYVYWTQPAERYRASGLLAVFAAPVSIALCIGWSRQLSGWDAGWAHRYVTLPSPLFAGVFIAALVYAKPMVRALVHGFLCGVFLLLAGYYVLGEHTRVYGERHAQRTTALVRDARGGDSIRKLARRHWNHFYPDELGFRERLERLAEAQCPPFDDPYSMLEARPTEVRSSAPTATRSMNGVSVLAVRAPALLRFPIPGDARAVRGRFGALRAKEPIDLHFVVELVAGERAPVLLFERGLSSGESGLLSFAVALPAEAEGELVVRTTSSSDAWAGIARIEFD